RRARDTSPGRVFWLRRVRPGTGCCRPVRRACRSWWVRRTPPSRSRGPSSPTRVTTPGWSLSRVVRIDPGGRCPALQHVERLVDAGLVPFQRVHHDLPPIAGQRDTALADRASLIGVHPLVPSCSPMWRRGRPGTRTMSRRAHPRRVPPVRVRRAHTHTAGYPPAGRIRGSGGPADGRPARTRHVGGRVFAPVHVGSLRVPIYTSRRILLLEKFTRKCHEST